MAVRRVTKISASSKKGWQDALRVGLARANKTLRNLTEITVLDQKVTVKKGAIDEYWVTLEIEFTLEEPKTPRKRKVTRKKK